MSIKIMFTASLLVVSCANASVLLWSNHKFEVSPLKPFSDENLQELVEELGYPEVTLYKTTSSLQPEFRELLKGFYTAYNPNGDINLENATEISPQDDSNLLEIKHQLDLSRQRNTLSVVVISNDRSKREVTTSPANTTTEPKALKGPIIYSTKSKLKDVYGLLYSSQPLLLKTNSSSLLLGNTDPDLVTMDTINKDSYTRLNVKIPVEENPVTLRFVFAWSYGYWTLSAVKISDTQGIYSFNLTSSISSVPAHFSYHCNGDTIFTDVGKTAELHIYDLQVQIDASRERFDDAYDCVDFTTGPIWSGLFVSAIMGIGLIVALVMISDIKTMDKFDNQKTKQLVITVAE